jgi:glycosyltransferase involved in cell wall biosynthesis
MDAPPAVSIVLPAWNAGATLREALSAIRAQSFTDWEAVIVDDGSEDDTRAVAGAAAHEDRRFRVLSIGHAGIVEALRQGCAAVRGRYLARMDADDRMHPARLADQVALHERDHDLALSGTGVRMTGDGLGEGRLRYEEWLNGLRTHADLMRDLFVECPLAHPTFMMRRDAYEAVGGYEDHGWAEDYDLVMRVARAGYQLGKVNAPLLDWRESPGRLSMTSPRYSPAQFRALKRHYLFQLMPLSGRLFVQWGAGEVGKRWLREWTRPVPGAVVDIHPRKVGRTIHGVPVIPPDALPPPGQALTVIAVGAPGARDEIRAWLNPRGYIETTDYLFLA